MITKWEEALQAVAPSALHGGVVTRDTVNGSGVRWISDHTAEYVSGIQLAPSYDVWSRWSSTGNSYDSGLFSGTNDYTFIVGCHLDSSAISGPFLAWQNEASPILDPLINPPYFNDTVGAPSFQAALDTIKVVQSWLGDWKVRIGGPNGWAHNIDNSDSDLQGSAAGILKESILGFAGMFQDLMLQMNTPNNWWNALNDAANSLWTVPHSLTDMWNAWFGTDTATPHGCVVSVFNNAMRMYGGPKFQFDSNNGVITSVDWGHIPGFGNPSTDAFWSAVEGGAKTIWQEGLTSMLDDHAGPLMQALAGKYIDAKNLIPTIKAPTPPPLNTDTGNANANANANLNTDNLTSGNVNANVGPGGLHNGNPTASSLHNASLHNGVLGSGAPGLGGLHNGNLHNGNLHNRSTGSPNLNPNLNGPGSQEVFGPNGQPITDPSTGLPLLVPPGTTIGPGGVLIGPDGKPITDSKGKPVTVPAGSSIGGNIGGLTNLVVPPGSTIGQNDTVVSATGQPVLDANGNPIVLPKGSTIAADGTVLGPNHKPILLSDQLLTDQEHALATQVGLGSGLSSGGSGLPLGLFPLFPPTTVPTVGSGQINGPGTVGVSPGALDQAAKLLPAGTSLPTSLTDLAAVPGLLGTTGSGLLEGGSPGYTQATSSSGEPFLPMGGGAGAGGQGGGQDRQRTTWLAEDEEVWGTETEAMSGTIGR